MKLSIIDRHSPIFTRLAVAANATAEALACPLAAQLEDGAYAFLTDMAPGRLRAVWWGSPTMDSGVAMMQAIAGFYGVEVVASGPPALAEASSLEPIAVTVVFSKPPEDPLDLIEPEPAIDDDDGELSLLPGEPIT